MTEYVWECMKCGYIGTRICDCEFTRIAPSDLGTERATDEYVEMLVAENATLKRENDALDKRNNQHTYCAYCGEEFPIDTDHAVDAVQAHIFECEKHPIYKLIHNIEEKCLDLDAEAQELLAEGDDHRDLEHASGIHKSIDAIRDVVRDALLKGADDE